MDEGLPLLFPGPRIALLARLGTMTIDDLRALDATVRALAADKALRGRVDRGFWFAWNDGLRLDRVQQADIAELFSDVMVAISAGITGLDVARFGARLGGGGGSGAAGGRAGGLASLFGSLRVKSDVQRRQETAIGLIHDAAGPWEPRLGLMACWNVACAAALRRHLKAPTVDVLEAAWRATLGEPPA